MLCAALLAGRGREAEVYRHRKSHKKKPSLCFFNFYS